MQLQNYLTKAALGKIEWIKTRNAKGLKEAAKFEQLILDQFGVKNLDGNDPKNDVEQYRRNFFRLVVVLENEGFANPEQMTIRKFYSITNYLEEKTRRRSNKRAS